MAYLMIICLAMAFFRKNRNCYGWSLVTMSLCFAEYLTMSFDAVWVFSAIVWAIAAGRFLFVLLSLAAEEERIAELFRNGQTFKF